MHLSKKVSVAVAGASGFIGSRICQELHHQGYKVYALVRPTSNIAHVNPYLSGRIICELSFANVDTIAQKLASCHITHIISALGSVNYHQTFADAYAANVDTTAIMVAVALKLQHIGQMQKSVFIGSVSSRGFVAAADVTDQKPFRWIDENTSYYQKGRSVYCDVKHECETRVRKSIAQDHLNALIVEPGSMVGPDIGGKTTTTTSMILKIIKGFPVLKGGASYISVQIAAGGIVAAMDKGKIGQTYLLGGENITMRDFARCVRSIYKIKNPNRKPPFLPVMSLPLPMSRWLGKLNLVVNHQQAMLGNAFHYIDWQKAARELDFHHSRLDLEQSVEQVLDMWHDQETI